MSTGWDPAQYQSKHSFVWRLGAGVLELLAPQPGERILDIGCGTGQLTAEIARQGAEVIGLDNSPDMVGQARQNYPGLNFVLADARDFHFDQPFDAVFSNAALHWVKDAEAAVQSIAKALRRGGRFVAEFGGHGNTRSILDALSAALGPEGEARNPWYYPSIAEYATLLERHGLELRRAELFDRPTPLEGEKGIENWLRMFCGKFFQDIPANKCPHVIDEIVERLRPQLYRDGVWSIDYRRLRVSAARCG